MNIFSPLFTLNIGGLAISGEIVIQWAVMIILIIAGILITSKLNMKPGKVQAVVELFYETVEKLVCGNMGKKGAKFIPFVGTLMVYLLVLNYTGLVGIAPATSNLNVAIGFAVTIFIIVHGYAIMQNGIGGYLKSYFRPMVGMLPLNIMERAVFPVALALRLFGNMLAAAIIVDLVYEGLSHLTWAAQIGLPIIVHGYFDVFDGAIQMIVFVMLTIVNIKVLAEH